MSLNTMPDAMARELIVALFENLSTHPIRTAEAFRNAILDTGHFTVNPAIDMHTEAEVVAAQNALKLVVGSGRMIDFGRLPNDVIKTTSLRSREPFEASEFEHPYPEWFAVSSWEGGMNGYLITKGMLPEYPGRIHCSEYYGVHLPGELPAVILYDIVGIDPTPGKSQMWPCRFVMPQTEDEEYARCANSLDPLVCFLRLLADASIPVVGRQVDERLNRARVKSGKRPIPPHHAVETRDYVSLFHASKAVRTSRGGHHASPVAHWRRAHLRHLASGKDVHVRSSRVNWREPAEIHRLFSRLQLS